MPKLNQDLTNRDIYLAIRQRNSLDFVADRADIGFNDIEQQFQNINFTIPFRLPELQNLKVAIDILLQESIGKVTMEPYDKMRLLVKVFGGEIFYLKINNGDEWRVVIVVCSSIIVPAFCLRFTAGGFSVVVWLLPPVRFGS